jgi:hypothetical protein
MPGTTDPDQALNAIVTLSEGEGGRSVVIGVHRCRLLVEQRR